VSDFTSVFVCDPHPIMVEGLRQVLAGDTRFSFAGASASLEEGLQKIYGLKPDVVLIDHSYGLKLISHFVGNLRLASPDSQAVLWVVEYSESDCLRALQMGAKGVLRKTLPIGTLLECLGSVAAGHVWLEESIAGKISGVPNADSAPRITRRERDVIECVSRGLTNREIAAELGITSGTVKVHLMHIFEKTGVKDRFELALRNVRTDAHGAPIVADSPRASRDPRRRG
jgi:DNA-binding NarL/FixJ family response regulator